MSKIDVFYQGGPNGRIERIEVEGSATIREVKDLIEARHKWGKGLCVFQEDGDDVLDDQVVIHSIVHNKTVKLHLNRCRHVAVSVSYAGKTVKRDFTPSATVAKVKRWSAEKEFGMSPEDASEHLLQLSGSFEQPASGTHIGTLTTCPGCRARFDLVPDQRVNGKPENDFGRTR